MLKVRTPLLILLVVGLLPADVLYLLDGRAIDGKLLSATSRQIRFLSAGERAPRAYQLAAVDRLRFGDANLGAGSSPSSRARSGNPAIPEGTIVTVRIDTVNSNATIVGDSYRASLDEPLVVDNQTLIQRGAEATIRVALADQSGATPGEEEIVLVLSEIWRNGRRHITETAIGAISGAGAGAAIHAIRGQKIEIPSETRLDFRLGQPIHVD